MKIRLAALFTSLIAGLATAPAHAIDPGTVQGHLQYGKQRYELRHVQAVRDPDNSKSNQSGYELPTNRVVSR